MQTTIEIADTSIAAFHNKVKKGAIDAQTQTIIDLVKAHPGETTADLREILRRENPNVSNSMIESVDKICSSLAKVGVFDDKGTKINVNGNEAHTYTFVSMNRRKLVKKLSQKERWDIMGNVIAELIDEATKLIHQVNPNLQFDLTPHYTKYCKAKKIVQTGIQE